MKIQDCYNYKSYSRINSSKTSSKEVIPQFKNTSKTENKAKFPQSIWHELSTEYDITNATFDELCSISSSLYQAKQISLADHAILTFNSQKSPQPINSDICLTPANQEGKRNWIAEYEARIERDKKLGNMLGFNNNQRILRILQRLRSK